ncbi:heliorhodopsin HeR [Aeromicrobium sp.]|uniref:heliorhodopsin HeR n=1 Tax=Aeromicrobium sp. TaxID=1871063 RepID=UPI003C625CE2
MTTDIAANRLSRSLADLADDERHQIGRLRAFNLVMGLVHAISASVMLALSNSFSIDVVSLFQNAQPGGELDPARLDAIGGLPIAALTVAFLYVSAFFHLLIASPLGWHRYEREIANGLNRFRWVEYSISSTLMIVAIALLPGLQDIASLVAIAGANVAMILFGWIMEVANPPLRTSTWWTPFTMGSIVAAVPWIAITIYLAGGSNVPSFVYVIFVSIFVLFNCFALNQLLQYRGRGRWSNYLFGERVYVWLSLIAKSVLAWQIFVNTLI